MKNFFLAEFLSSLVILIILFSFMSFENLTMPLNVNLMLIGFFVIAYLIYFSLGWRESPADEREDLHARNSGRMSFFVGSTVLTIAFIVQSFSHNIDPWIVYSLSLMVLAKILSRVYYQLKN